MVYQGKVTYKKDPNLVAWGCPEVQTYILDENGDRIPETKPFVDPDMIRWILSHRRPELSFACVYSGPGPNRVGVVEFFVEGKFSRLATARYSFSTGSYCPLVAELAGSGCVCSHSARAEAVGSMPAVCHHAVSSPRRCSSR